MSEPDRISHPAVNEHIIEGPVYFIGEEQAFGGFRKRTIVIGLAEEKENRPENKSTQFVPFDAHFENGNLFDQPGIDIGETVQIIFKFEGRQQKNDPTKYWGSNVVLNIKPLAKIEQAEPKAHDMGDDDLAF